MNTLEQIATVSLDAVPIVSRDRHIPRKEQARLARNLFRQLGIKGVSVVTPNHSMASSVDVRLPDLALIEADYHGPNDATPHSWELASFADMPANVPAKIKQQAHWQAQKKIETILARAFPAHNDRSDYQTDYFDFKWSVS